VQYNQSYNNNDLQAISDQYQQAQYGQQIIQSGLFIPLSIAFVQETTVFREFGPLSGNTMQLRYEFAPKIGGSLSRQTLDLDARRYLRVGGSGLLALRGRAFKSWGAAPTFLYFGGNSEMHGYDYLQFIGQNAIFGNAELRFPIIQAMLTPIGVLGGIRGVFFFNIGAGWFPATNPGFKFATAAPETVQPIVGYAADPVTGAYIPVYGDPITVTGFRLVDSRASYGFGLETFVLGFPIHFDWSWRTMFNTTWENLVYGSQAASFRKVRFGFWIGYDF